ncbi:Na-Ca exchanger/integrin-beta4 [Sulfurimonas denitrificans DSM 1251]|uniref:Na-Ca exchanger/integrin-beta4 n=1 Tax=Sulfurimonas denitrificans (strain ATCC 33889 / DSM 1251) TaxID=326298 RepID=Q30PU5_SULDN|nr:Calx-beta domain-containing protein [Sulfurimonas denitrificans]ABB44986.1 Na-Ca exchanger/integrin-beta4 [Sulfurimonas denitrificans DSM 1251]MDD3443568.1 Calx-beta domain-containing protein [Sulfurimonas denitrificans]
MTTYLNNYLDSRYKTYKNDFYNGVVRVSYGGYFATGTLLYDGVSILTSAHLFNSLAPSDTTVRLETSLGTVTYDASYTKYEKYDPTSANGDLAIVKLSQSALVDAQRYTLYRQSDEIGKTFTMAGYGIHGNGATGVDERDTNQILKLKTQNTFDADFADIKAKTNLSWSPLAGSQLAADFDDGYAEHDAIGMIMGNANAGLGTMEGLIASGDSGGPAFIDNKLAGVATFVATIDVNGISPDINSSLDSSFGEVASWQRISYYQEWIDKTIRTSYLDAPTKPQDVVKNIKEGADSEVSTTYFLVQYLGIRADIGEIISVDYATRDGSARAGEDYIATKGTLILYLDETQALIPVEIIGDSYYEEDETFYLDIYNNSHGSLGDGVVMLSAMRTIINDDFLL